MSILRRTLFPAVCLYQRVSVSRRPGPSIYAGVFSLEYLMFWIARSFSVVLHFPAHIFLRLLLRSYRLGFHCHLSRLFRRTLFPAVCLYQRVSVSRMPYLGSISIPLYKSIISYPVVTTMLLNGVKRGEQRHSGTLPSGYGCVPCKTGPA